MGKVQDVTVVNKANCKICKCECENSNCWETCAGHSFEIMNNTFGCEECSCICLNIDCDAKCGGEGLGVIGPTDKAGCMACSKCQKKGNGMSYFKS